MQISHLQMDVYHPQTDGMVEQFNQMLKGMLQATIQGNPKDCDLMLDPLLFSITEAPQVSIGFSPIELVYEYQSRGLWI